jgi:hypothetical protein
VFHGLVKERNLQQLVFDHANLVKWHSDGRLAKLCVHEDDGQIARVGGGQDAEAARTVLVKDVDGREVGVLVKLTSKLDPVR